MTGQIPQQYSAAAGIAGDKPLHRDPQDLAGGAGHHRNGAFPVVIQRQELPEQISPQQAALQKLASLRQRQDGVQLAGDHQPHAGGGAAGGQQGMAGLIAAAHRLQPAQLIRDLPQGDPFKKRAGGNIFGLHWITAFLE